VINHNFTHDVKVVALNLMEGLSCPRSLTVAILLRYEEWTQLVELRVDPRNHNCPETFWAASAATGFLRKCAGLETGIDTEAAALKTWYASEELCYRTNQRFTELYSSGVFPDDSPEARVQRHLAVVRKEVVRLIGTHPPDLLQGKFGPGATMSDKSRFTTVADKMSSIPSYTINAIFHLLPWVGTEWGRASAKLRNETSLVKGNQFFTVPKDATTDRGCGKEPSINAFYQAACGQVMRRRLKRCGIDLKDGQTTHRQVACSASISGDVCTIDLSSASDTISRVLVKLLLPPKWYDLLDSLRSPFTRIGGEWQLLEKFSSMGNGFTFELETVIFAALSLSVQKTPQDRATVTVYGDDIIVPKNSFDDVIALLRYCGFSPNTKKTFSDGYFRESCGGDFFNGIAVRPYHMENLPSEAQDYISLANGIRRLAHQESGSAGRWHLVRRAWFSCLDNLPTHIRACRGPEALGDLVIHDDEERWKTRWRSSGIRFVRCYRPASFRRVRWEGFSYDVQFASALYLAGKGENARDRDGNLSPRDNVLGYKVGWTPFS
jgi:hypothetical protein